MDDLRVLLVGPCHSAEFSDAAAELTQTVHVTAVPNLPTAIDLTNDGRETLDLILMAQGFPRQFSAVDVERLRCNLPTAPIVTILGSWCEGEERTGTPLPGTQRVYWHRWSSWWATQLLLLEDGRCPDWGLPVTSSEEDRRMQGFAPALPRLLPNESRRLILVAATQWDMNDLLCEACRTWGFEPVGVNPREHLPKTSAAAVLWDCRDVGDLTELQRLKQHHDQVPILALASFPRWQHREKLMNEGLAAVLSKPVRLEELRVALEPLIRPAKTQPQPQLLNRVA